MTRRLSWFLGALAYALPPIWAYWSQSTLYAEAKARGQYLCGLPYLAIVTLACLGSAILGAAACGFGYRSYRHLPKPRPLVRSVELVVLTVPLVLGLALFALLLSG